MNITHKSGKMCMLTACIFMMSCIMTLFLSVPEKVSALSVDYPAETVRISTADNSRNLNISGYTDKSACNTWTTNGSQNENWRFDYTGTNSVGSFFRITNMGTGRLLTPLGYSVTEGTSCVIFGSENKSSQYWYVTAVEQDKYGNDLYYKITNYDDSNMALTYNAKDNNITLSKYTGAGNQKWLINASGLQGFAGYCKDSDGNVKASAIGGLLGETVEVTTFDELKKACSDDTPRTIVITKDISKTGKYTTTNTGRYQFSDARIYLHPNKTIIGSYSANSLYNVYFQTYEGNYGQGHNIILRNIEISHDTELNSDNIWEFSYGWNFWIDHCTFVGHSAINTASTGQDDWDKFLNFKGATDFITISDCKFGLHEYGVLLGYPTDTQEIYDTYNGHPCVTMADNYYKDCITRAPALMRYGYFHSLNNYAYNFNMGYTIYTACKLYAENCYYDGGDRAGSIVNDSPSATDISSKYVGAYTDSGSVAVNCYKNNNLGNINSVPCNWRPSANYSYTAKTANEAKTYCETYSGSQKSRSNMTYASFTEAGVPSAVYITTPDSDMNESNDIKNGAVIDTTCKFMLKNANSGLYMEVESGKAENGTNVQQWGADLPANHNSWKAVSAGDGYYYIYSQVGDGKTYLLDIDFGRTDNGTNIGIYADTKSDAQLFKFVKNSDNSYTIVTKVSDDTSCIEIGNASKDFGANVQEWKCNGNACQNWIIEYIEPELIAGDINMDGVVDCFDMVMARRGLSNSFDSENTERCADVNADGSLDGSDLKLLSDYILGKNVKLTLRPEVQTPVNVYEPKDFSFSGNVYLVGDSTVCEYDSTFSTAYNRYGWGMKLADKFSGVKVTNLALSGRSSRSFLEESNYTVLCNSIGKGDYLFIQFGHNDEKTDESVYPGLGTYPKLDMKSLDGNGKNSKGQYSYDWILLNKYIKIAQAKGAVPVLITPITRLATDGKPYYQAHTDYQQAMIALGKQYNIPVIDTTTLTTELYNNLYTSGGAGATAEMHCYADEAKTTLDNTHLSNLGATRIAGIIAEQTNKLGLTIGNYLK